MRCIAGIFLFLFAIAGCAIQPPPPPQQAECPDVPADMCADVISFFQTENAPWRILAQSGCYRHAAWLLDRYLALHPDLPKEMYSAIRYETGRMYAAAGEIPMARAQFVAARQIDPPDALPSLWNYYVGATLSFLDRDLDSLQYYHEKFSDRPRTHKEEKQLAEIEAMIQKSKTPSQSIQGAFTTP